VRSATFRPIFKQLFWLIMVDAAILGYVGSQPVSDFLTTVGQLATAYYFGHFLVILPLLSKFEKTRPLPASISAAVLSSTEKA
jgi:quinol-cytochrome oxidoreductase complex cytochrome b subunit